MPAKTMASLLSAPVPTSSPAWATRSKPARLLIRQKSPLPGTGSRIRPGKSSQDRQENRLPPDHQGGLRRRWSGHARGQEPRIKHFLEEAQGEIQRAFGNSAVFLELHRARQAHRSANPRRQTRQCCARLHERDCSVQRRHQKVIEIAPSIEYPTTSATTSAKLLQIAKSIGYYNAGTVEFLDTHEWFFIEMNPRIQVSIPSP